jgi:N-carbamoylputrescine amidase
VRVALIQESFLKSRDEIRERLIEKITLAKAEGAKLVVLPELHESHYFCINESVDSFDLAEDFDDVVKFYSRVAKEYGLVLVTSLFEKRAEGLYHNSAVVFDRDGSIAGKYRKMHIPDDPGFYEKFYFTPGDLGFEPIQTSVGKLGVLICWDQWYPEAARIMALKGADILIYPTAIGWFDEDSKDEREKQLDSWITIQRSHAIANGTPVVSVNRVGFERDNSKAIDGIRFWGNSFVVGSSGEFLTKLGEVEELSVIDIDLKNSHKVRRIWPFLRDRRIDCYDEITKRYID